MANIHYFQRYHTEENVHTANAFLLINRLYQYNPQYFYEFLKGIIDDPQLDYQFQLSMTLQTKSKKGKNSTIPDAMLMQNGYRICVETKIKDWFYPSQIQGHIEAFEKCDTRYKLFLTLSNVNDCAIKNTIEEMVQKFNEDKNLFNEERLVYRHMTFEKLVDSIESLLTERDYEFRDVIDDYRDYCTEQNLIDDRYQLMKIYATGDTFEINKKLNLYYRRSTDNIYADILGMYKDKRVYAVGRIVKTVKAYMPENELILPEGELLTEDERARIIEAIEDSQRYGYNLKDVEHNFFLVDGFEECNFVKASPYGLLGSKKFKLESDYGISDIKNKSTKQIAEELSDKTWF